MFLKFFVTHLGMFLNSKGKYKSHTSVLKEKKDTTEALSLVVEQLPHVLVSFLLLFVVQNKIKQNKTPKHHVEKNLERQGFILAYRLQSIIRGS